MRLVTTRAGVSLDDYAADAELVAAVEGLRAEAEQRVAALRGRVVWMVNSTATGGGVAELLPTQVSILRELGVDVRWVVIDADRPEFFPLTKRLHNMIHGAAEPPLAPADRQLYEAVSRANADALLGVLAPNDVLVVHDPQPLGAGALVKRELGVRTIWRCHIGVDERPPAADDAWEFLRPYATVYDRAVFSAEEYIPPFLSSCSSVVHPTIDPLSHKNRDLSLHKLVGILSGAALAVPHWPLITPPFPDAARRLQAGGTFEPATLPEDIGLLARPIILQVSRWDRLKGFAPLLEAFRIFKLRALRGEYPVRGARHQRRVEVARLVLAGPEPESIQDDPEALGVLDELRARYVGLESEVQRDVAIVALPMRSRKNNALMVNALQRCADVVVQNSLREGFGLTVAEAMWKRKPVLGSARAFGVRMQVRDGVDGMLAPDPEDAVALGEAIHEMLASPNRLEDWGRNAQLRVHQEFLMFTELGRWLSLLTDLD
ncbi:MAG TPA: glycosyltransferase [Gemmatimonadaceae bacterium]|nr:glycosyltransferase [Gemmatimonadaceae bacterium]